MGKQFDGVAALTIVSKNYISFARVLCDSFLDAHPGADFFVVLVDKLDGEFDPEEERFTLLSMDEIRLPAVDVFPYQYTILELNTAVKPFALKYLLEDKGIEKLAYIDPDIMIFKALDKVWDALDDHSVVLTPHMREPFYDGFAPDEVGILQSGTYNLGFIGLKNNASSIKLLDWWIGKLYLDCVVDIPKGLFVDQKWMDLVPAYFDDTYILHDPTYNAAYWNLHERDVEVVDGNYYIEDKPLTFFHFSGFNPLKSDILSKHQTRHELKYDASLASLFDLYKTRLLDAGFRDAAEYKYAYGHLPNGVRVSRCIHPIIRRCLKKHIPFPSPEYEPDAFCRFLMTPNPMLYGQPVAPIVHGVLNVRPDVKKHYPNAWHRYDEGFLDWVKNSGGEEEGLSHLFDGFRDCLSEKNPIERVRAVYDRRLDVQAAYPNLATNFDYFKGFCRWLDEYGTVEEGLPEGADERLMAARNGFFKALTIYFLRPDLQNAFPDIHSKPEGYFNWMLHSLADLQHLTEDDVHVFLMLAKHSRELIIKMQLRYNMVLRGKVGSSLTFFNADKYAHFTKKYFDISDEDAVRKAAVSEQYATPLWQLEALYVSSPELQENYPGAFESPTMLAKLSRSVLGIAGYKMIFKDRSWIKRLQQQVANYKPNHQGINLAGYFDASTGMGQSSRSMLKTIEAAGLNVALKTLPNVFLDPSNEYISERVGSYYGCGKVENRINLTVSNADMMDVSTGFFSESEMAGRRNIGYWVWETEELPARFAKAAELVDEVWTPSEYSAAAIRKCIDKPVHVLPHVLDFDEIDRVVEQGPMRESFDLPEDVLLFGFFFDQKSILERKNPQAVIESFRRAFGSGEQAEAALVLKVNTPKGGELEYELLKAENKDLNIIWIEETLTRERTLQLMNSLDVYVSLHRSEGFGLTMAEAMALGKPVIASNYSGNTDFMDEDNSLLVDVECITTKKGYGPYPRGTVWCEPDVIAAADMMKKATDDRVRGQIGEAGSFSIRKKLSPDVVGDCLREVLVLSA